MLVRLVYASRAEGTIDDALINAILEHSWKHNLEKGITGLLCTYAPSNIFIQVLEGGRATVNALYGAIVRDPRHRDVTLLDYAEITERRYAGWRMGCVNLNRVNQGIILRFSEQTTLDPFAMTGPAVLALLDELMNSGAIVVRDGP